MNQGELESEDLKFKLALFGILGIAGAAVYSLTRKSEEVAPVPEVLPPAPPAEVPVARPLVKMPDLDPGLSDMERFAVQKAVSTETLAANLNGFASTFEPQFPIAAAVLRAQAASLQKPSVMTGGAEPCCQDCEDHPEKPPCTPKVTGAPIFRGLPNLYAGEIVDIQ